MNRDVEPTVRELHERAMSAIDAKDFAAAFDLEAQAATRALRLGVSAETQHTMLHSVANIARVLAASLTPTDPAQLEIPEARPATEATS